MSQILEGRGKTTIYTKTIQILYFFLKKFLNFQEGRGGSGTRLLPYTVDACVCRNLLGGSTSRKLKINFFWKFWTLEIILKKLIKILNLTFERLDNNNFQILAIFQILYLITNFFIKLKKKNKKLFDVIEKSFEIFRNICNFYGYLKFNEEGKRNVLTNDIRMSGIDFRYNH